MLLADRVSRAFCGVGFLAVVALCPDTALAGATGPAGSWLRLDGSTGAVASVAVSPSDSQRVYVGTADGVFQSEDGGLTWTRWRSGLSFTLINCLAVTAEPSEVVYAGTAGGGIFRSDDLGETWRSASQGAAAVVRRLEVDPSRAANAYAISGGVLRTQQGGDYWYPSGAGIGPGVAVGVARSDPNMLYAVAPPPFGGDGVPAYFVYRSLDGGENWSLDPPESPLRLTFLEETVLEIDPVDSGVVFVGGVDGLFRRSPDAAWRAVALRSGTPPRVRAVAIAPDDRSVVYVASDGEFFRSLDGGATWSQTAAPGGTSNRVYGLGVSTGDSNALFAATRFGLYRSLDGGEHWLLTERGLPPASALGFAFDPANPIHLFLNSNRGLIESRLGGAVWEEPDASLVDARRENRLFPISQAWSTAGSGVAEVFVDPSNPRRILVAANGLSLSEDGGRSFTRRWPEEINALAFSPADPSTIYAATVGAGVIKSVDRGVTWRDSAEGLPFDDPTPGYTIRTFFEVSVDPSNPSTVYAGGHFGLHRSVDGGAHWSQPICCPFRPAAGVAPALVFSDQANVVSLAFDPTDAAILYAGANPGFEYRNRLYKTVDGGQTWRASDQGLPEGARTLVTVDPNDPSLVYAGTWGFGVFRSPDAGARWEPFNQGLENLFVKSIGFDPVGRLYAGTEGGLYRLRSSPAAEPAPVRPIQSVSGNLFPSGEVELNIGLFRTSPNSTVPVQTTFVETLPKGLTLVDATTDRGTLILGPSLNTVTWMGSLAVRMSAEIRLKARVDDDAGGREPFSQGIAYLAGGAFSLSGSTQTPQEPTRLLIGERPSGADAIFVPAALPIAGSFVGVATANLGASPVTPRIESRAADGSLVAQEDLAPLDGLGQTTFIGAVAAGGGDSVLVRGTDGGLSGFFLIGDEALDRLDGIGGALLDAQTLIFPFGGSKAGGQVLLSVFNPDADVLSNAVLRLVDAQGETMGEAALEVAPLGSRTASIRELFGRSGESDWYVKLEADRPLRGFQIDVSERSFSAAGARPPVWTERLWSPHFFFGPDGSTTIRVVNPLASTARLRIRIVDDQRGLLAEPSVEIGPGALGEFDLLALSGARGGESAQGFVEILADGGEYSGAPLEAALVAVSVYQAAGGELRSNLPLFTGDSLEASFLQVAQSTDLGLFQGLAVVAPTGAELEVSVFDEAGRQTARRAVTLEQGTRLVGLLDDPALFGPDFQQTGGILQLRASRGVIAYSLFGGARFLAAVEGQ